jgi:hypothetical protein
MFLTFFCKRDKHKECPGNWPIDETCSPDEDCSFDMKMAKCECDCHDTNTASTNRVDIKKKT